MWKTPFWMTLLRAPEGASGDGGTGGGAPGSGAAGSGAAGTGGAGAGGGAGGGDAAAAAAAAAGGAGGGAPDPYWRDFLPDNLKGEKPEETFGRLADAWKTLRDSEAKRPAPAPKTAAEYGFEPSEKVKPYFEKGDDKLLNHAREAALAAGLPKDAFGAFVNAFYEKAVEAGALVAPYNPEGELKAIGERVAPGKPWAEQRVAVEQAVRDATSFADVLGERLKLSPGAKGALAALTDDAAGVELISALSGALGKDPAFSTAGGAAAAMTKDDLHKAVADPRFNPLSPQYDKAWRANIDEQYKRVFGS